MSSKKATPKGSIDPKGVLTRLFSCGSGKKQLISDQKSLPTRAMEEEEEEFDSVNRQVTTVQSVKVQNGNEEDAKISYTDVRTIGKGTFGVVYKARLCDNSKIVAIKKVFDDKRYKNRELLFMKQLSHPNIANLLYYFYSEDAGCRKGERYLNMILEFIPKTLFGLAKCDGTYTKPLLDPLYIKVYTYQMFRCLNYLHSQNICHRDIKPQNLLIDPSTHVLKLCDFGSAKELLKNESNVSYICSRYYRAPELIFGAKDYSCLIDMWSGGCVLGELFQGHPLFPGATGPDQLVEIMKVLGTPTYDDIIDINHGTTNMRLPPVLVPLPWHKIFTKQQPSYDAIDLISKLLVFSPKKRMDAMSACAHPFYNELRTYGVKLPDGSPLPPLFNFTKDEVAYSPQIAERLTPPNWSEEWNDPSLFGNSLGVSQASADDSLKKKLVMLARNSFKKSSFKVDKGRQVPPNGFEVRQEDDDDNNDGDARPTMDVMDLAREAHQRMNLSTRGDETEEEGEGRGGGGRGGGSTREEDDDINAGVLGLSIRNDPEVDRVKKKKKKSTAANGKRIKEPKEEEEEEGWAASPSIVDSQDELDAPVPVSHRGAGEGSSLTETKTKRKKKKKTPSKSTEDGSPAVRAWDGNLSEGELRAVHSSTPADFREATGPEAKVVKKVRVKKQRSREGSLARGSFEDLDEISMDAPPPSPSYHNKETKGRTRAANRTAGEGGFEGGARGERVVTSVVTTATVEHQPMKVKKKKKMKTVVTTTTTHNYDEDDEV